MVFFFKNYNFVNVLAFVLVLSPTFFHFYQWKNTPFSLSLNSYSSNQWRKVDSIHWIVYTPSIFMEDCFLFCFFFFSKSKIPDEYRVKYLPKKETFHRISFLVRHIARESFSIHMVSLGHFCSFLHWPFVRLGG